jgi:hypothetical protein
MPEIARLDDEQLARISDLEQELGVILVAYEDGIEEGEPLDDEKKIKM